MEEEGQQHEQASIMHDPPDVDGSLQALQVGREDVHVLGHQQGLVSRRCLPDGLCGEVGCTSYSTNKLPSRWEINAATPWPKLYGSPGA